VVPQRRVLGGDLRVIVVVSVLARAGAVRFLACSRAEEVGIRLRGCIFGGCAWRINRGFCRLGSVQPRQLHDLSRDLVALEQRIFLEETLQLLVQLEGRQLQQPDRLLKLRSECEVL
jgi:hypothetical protein